MIGAGSSSLLRPPAVLIASVALVVVVLGCGNTAYASDKTARNPDPAPSPAPSARSTGPVSVQLLGAGCVTTADDGGGAPLGVPLRRNERGRGCDAA